jgi:autoinducer 2-degrading protein
MFTVIVNLQVRPECREEFLAGIRTNALASVRDEPGCLRFDVHEKVNEPNKFVLYELYADEAAFYEAHRSAPHYEKWREVSARCIYPGGHVNTLAAPAFASDIPEHAQTESTQAELQPREHPNGRRTSQ